MNNMEEIYNGDIYPGLCLKHEENSVNNSDKSYKCFLVIVQEVSFNKEISYGFISYYTDKDYNITSIVFNKCKCTLKEFQIFISSKYRKYHLKSFIEDINDISSLLKHSLDIDNII